MFGSYKLRSCFVVFSGPCSAKVRGKDNKQIPGILPVKTHGSIIRDFKSANRPLLCYLQPSRVPSLEICPDPTGPATFRKDRSAVEDLSSVSFFGRKCPGVSAKELLWASVVLQHWKAFIVPTKHKEYQRIHLQIMPNSVT